MKYTITVYDATETLPSRSGNYLARVNSSYWTELSYSERYKLFNVYDGDKSLDNAIDVDFWTVMPKVERKVKNETLGSDQDTDGRSNEEV